MDNSVFATDPGRPHLGGYIPDGDEYTKEEDIKIHLLTKLQPQSVLDIGCGDGSSTVWWQGKVDVIQGVEGFERGALATRARGIPCDIHDYTWGNLYSCGQFDLGWCVEVVEHIEDRYAPRLLDTFFRCKTLAMTHALPGQPGWHHVNCKPQQYWIDVLRPFLTLNPDLTHECQDLSTGHGRTMLVFNRNA
jgi:2-polyprenyl-3-methyl-5-hydroxy-6-metoxy-1,4-benzoquinol methylase